MILTESPCHSGIIFTGNNNMPASYLTKTGDNTLSRNFPFIHAKGSCPVLNVHPYLSESVGIKKVFYPFPS